MKLPVDPRLGLDPGGQTFVNRLSDLLTQSARQVNALTEGSIASQHGARISVPTSGLWRNGDVVRNSQPSLKTDDPSHWPDGYVVYGWMCIVSGEPGTWTELRFGYFVPASLVNDFLLLETGDAILSEAGNELELE